METKKRFAVILAGCGHRDGAEITESVMALYAIARSGSTYEVFAPDKNQYHVINHLTGQPMKEERNIRVEVARIARGKVSPLSDFNIKNFDILMFAGGFGVAKNLCTYAFYGADCVVDPEIQKIIQSMHNAGKPIGALCISPVLLASVLKHVNITMGQDKEAIANIEAMGATHQVTNPGEIVIDEENKIVTAPCYMLDSDIVSIADENLLAVEALLKLAQ